MFDNATIGHVSLLVYTSFCSSSVYDMCRSPQWVKLKNSNIDDQMPKKTYSSN